MSYEVPQGLSPEEPQAVGSKARLETVRGIGVANPSAMLRTALVSCLEQVGRC
jgi:hypothetical protein